MNLVGLHDGSVLSDFYNKEDLLIIAGPCAIESLPQMEEVAKFLVENNITFMRAGIFKPRTSPYSFQGLGEEAFQIVKYIKEKYNLKIVSEIVNIKDIEFYKDYVDIVQIGARNMQNFEILKELGKTKIPVLLKRGFGNTIEEWLNACEYILSYGNSQVILCERGIRTFEPSTRNTLDISSVPVVKNLTKIPVIVDPSHASGRADLVGPLSLASIASGADGLMIEIHPSPKDALSDKDQAIGFDEARNIFKKVREINKILGKDKN